MKSNLSSLSLYGLTLPDQLCFLLVLHLVSGSIWDGLASFHGDVQVSQHPSLVTFPGCGSFYALYQVLHFTRSCLLAVSVPSAALCLIRTSFGPLWNIFQNFPWSLPLDPVTTSPRTNSFSWCLSHGNACFWARGRRTEKTLCLPIGQRRSVYIRS